MEGHWLYCVIGTGQLLDSCLYMDIRGMSKPRKIKDNLQKTESNLQKSIKERKKGRKEGRKRERKKKGRKEERKKERKKERNLVTCNFMYEYTV